MNLTPRAFRGGRGKPLSILKTGYYFSLPPGPSLTNAQLWEKWTPNDTMLPLRIIVQSAVGRYYSIEDSDVGRGYLTDTHHLPSAWRGSAIAETVNLMTDGSLKRPNKYLQSVKQVPLDWILVPHISIPSLTAAEEAAMETERNKGRKPVPRFLIPGSANATSQDGGLDDVARQIGASAQTSAGGEVNVVRWSYLSGRSGIFKPLPGVFRLRAGDVHQDAVPVYW